jgi:NADH:ubiquinone oxidoreductase subunit 6 (subunit J)
VTLALFIGLSILALVGAAFVVFTRDVMRLALGLGVFLLSVAGLFALFGFGFLALAEIFVYVGGVLVLLLFAIMLVHRSNPGAPSLSSRHHVLALVACLGVFGFLLLFLRPVAPDLVVSPTGSVDLLGGVLLGRMLPQFELAGVLLLAALVAVVSVSGGGE